MSKEVILKNGRKAIEATYSNDSLLGENNPLLDALDSLPDDRHLVKLLSKYPKYSDGDRELDMNTRILLTSSINACFQALPETLDVVHKLYYMLVNGYRHRNPFSRAVVMEHHNIYNELHGFDSNIDSGLNSASNCVIIGASGSGKTSTVLNSIQSLFPQLIVHSNYNGQNFSAYQCTFLYCTMSKDGSVKSMFYEILSQVDILLGTNHAQRAKNDTADILLLKVKSILLNIHTGCLIIDEFQHISLQKSGGKDRIFNIFLNLSDIGIPVLIISTPQGVNLLKQSGFRQVRRNLGSGGSIVFDRIKDKNIWRLLMKSIWKYQYCMTEVKLTQDFVDLFYDLSIGLPSMLKSLYQAVQIECIRSGKETFDKKLVLEVFNSQFQMAIPAVKAFRSGILKEMIMFEDIFISSDKVEDLSELELIEVKRLKQNKRLEESSKNITEKVSTDDFSAESTLREPVLGDIRSIIKLNSDESISNYAVLKESGIIANSRTDMLIGVNVL